VKKAFLSFLFSVFPLISVHAASDGTHGYHIDVDLNNKPSLQRGARLFVNYCLSCHSAAYMRYSRMAEDLGIPKQTLEENLMFTTDKAGDTMDIAMTPEYGETAFLGVAPPDLSVIARARGADWLYAYLMTFYSDPSRPFGVNNLQFKNSSMPHVLWELQGIQRPVYKTVTQNNGSTTKVVNDLEIAIPGKLTPDEYDKTIHDLVNFLVYLSEPAQLERKNIGIWVLLYLVIFLVVAYYLKKEYWRDVK